MGNVYPGGESISFLCFNRNKRSVTIDLKQERGKEVARRLIAAADVVTENFRPGVMDRLGIGYEALAAVNPRLIYCASSGFGQTGPYVTRPGQDLLIQAMAGVGYLNGGGDGPPQGVAVGIADLVAAQHIVYGVLAALYHREKTGQGQRVDVSLLNSLLALHVQELAVYLNGGGLPERSRNGIPGPYLGAPYGFYETTDGYIAIAMNPLNKLAALVGVAGYEACAESNVMEGRDEVRADFARAFKTRSTQEWLDVLLAEDVWCAPVQTYEEVERDPQVAENEMIVGWEHPTAGTVRTTGIPVKFGGTPGAIERPAPLLGEHSADLLRAFGGYTDAEIGELQAQGVVGA